MGGIGLSGITGGDSATGADDITGGNNASEDGDGSGDPGTATEPESSPVSVLPGAFLQGGSLAFKSDSGDNVPVVGLENAIADFADGDQVIISDIELEAEVACLEKGSTDRWFEGSMVKKISNLVISEAHAEDTGSICDDEDKTCCPIQDDGSFECFYPLVDQSVASVFISVVDADGNYVTDEVAEETIQPNLMYLRNTPTDVAALDGALYSIAGTNIVSITTDEEDVMRVANDYANDYRATEDDADGTKFSFSTNDNLVGVLSETAGIQLLDKTGDVIIDAEEPSTDANATVYTFIRPIDNILYYGFEQVTNTEAYLMYATTQQKIDDADPAFYNPILIIDDDTVGETLLHHTKTLAFDSVTVGGDDWRVVALCRI